MMNTLPHSWPFPESVIPVGCGEDQRAANGLPDRSALSLSVPTKRRPPIQLADITDIPAAPY